MTVGIKRFTVHLLWEPKPNRKPRFFLQNLPKPTDGKIFETVTTLEWCSYNFAAGSFHTKQLYGRHFFERSWILLEKQQNPVLCHPLGLRGNVHGSSRACWKARGQLSISANWNFSPAFMVEALWADIGQNCGFWKEGGSLWAQISGGKWSPTNDCWRQKTRVRGLLYGIVCVILRLAVLIQFWRVTDTHMMTANTRTSIAPRGQKCYLYCVQLPRK